MKTFPLKHSGIDITDMMKNYSYMERKLYVHFELSRDKGFEKELRYKFGLDSWFYESCRMDVQTKIAQNETQHKKKLKQIADITKSLEITVFKGKADRKKKFNMLRKLRYLQSHIENNITFGEVVNLRKITYLHNKIKGLADGEEKVKRKKS